MYILAFPFICLSIKGSTSNHLGKRAADFKVVLEGYRRCPDSHVLSECHHLTTSHF